MSEEKTEKLPMCNISMHMHVHHQQHYQLFLSSDCFNFPTEQRLLPASLHILFILQFISTYVFKNFLCVFLKKDSDGKSSFLWEKPPDFISCQTVGSRVSKNIPIHRNS